MEILPPKNKNKNVCRANTGSTDELRSSRAPQKLRTVRAQLLRCMPALWLVCGGSFWPKYVSEQMENIKK